MRKNHPPIADAEDDFPPVTGLWDAFIRQIGSFIGIFIIAAVAAAALALASWNFADPSLNNYATLARPTNIFGFWGASFADLFMQFFGLGSLATLMPPFFWGVLLIAQKGIPHFGRRILWLILGICALSLACGLLPPPPNWPMPLGLGGVVGDKLIGLFSVLIPIEFPHILSAALGLFVLFPLSLIIAAYAGGVLGRGQKSRDDRAKKQFGIGRLRDKPAGGGKNRPEEPPMFFPDNDDALAERDTPQHSANDNEREYTDDDIEADYDGKLGLGDRLSAAAGLIQHYCLRIASLFGHKPHMRSDCEFGLSAGERAEPSFSGNKDGLTPEYSFAAAPQIGGADEAPITKKQQSVQRGSEKINLHKDADNFILPSVNYLSQPKKFQQNAGHLRKTLHKNAQELSRVLEDFGVNGEIIHAYPGPVVTLYEFEPARGVKSARVISLSDDIARSMSAVSARIAVMSGRKTLGIELPNAVREKVYLREIIEEKQFIESKEKLALALGKNIGGEPVLADLTKMPHLLVAGTTGSGKSVAINTMILSLLYRMTPQQCRLILVDPKMLELSVYEGIPHLLTPVVTDPKKALSALKWAVKEMEERYRKMAKLGVRNIDGFNARVKEAKTAGESNLRRTVQTGFDRETGEPVYETEELEFETLPYIVVIIDEMADLMMVAGKEIESAVQRLAQMARAAGIHVIMATQRPSVDVITGTIKANFPTRISFQVTSKIDSRTILGEQGAETLLGMGDMLYMEGGGRIQRVHGPFVGDEEVERVVAHLKKQDAPEYLSAVMECNDDEDDGTDGESGGADSDDPYDKAVDIVLRDRRASTSYIQRRLGIGYNRAASLIERMEDDGIISSPTHAGKREILVPQREAS